MTLIADVASTLADVRAPRRALRYLAATAFLLDLTVIGVVGALAIVARDTFLDLDGEIAGTLDLAGPLILALWLALIALMGGYQRGVFGVGTDEYKRLLNAALVTAAAAGIGCYLLQFPLSRGFFLVLFVAGTPALLAGRYLLRRALHRARRRGHLLRRVVISGSPAHVDEIAAVLRRDSWLGYQVIGALTPPHDPTDLTPSGVQVLGRSATVTAVVQEHDADIVFFADHSTDCSHELRRLIWELESHRVQVVVAPSVADISNDRFRIRPVGGMPLIHVEKPRHRLALRGAKRVFDVVGALLLLVVFSPLALVVALRIKVHDGGPVLYRQTRIGRDAAEFGCLKFRTMVADADELRAQLVSDRGQDVLFKMKDDPRVTDPGRWLRRHSIDELPQLFNVLAGEMSLVGPRPCLPDEYARYTADAERRLRVRPGITGLWQVSGRSELTFDDAVRLDLYYVDNWSMVQDLAILARTFGVMARSRGAY